MVVSLAIAAAAILALTHALENIDYDEVFAVVRCTDAAILIGPGGEHREPLIAALLVFRVLYHLLPFMMALALFGVVGAWRVRAKRRLTPANSA